jgi:tetratricopeptide (TPR) repeat protein
MPEGSGRRDPKSLLRGGGRATSVSAQDDVARQFTHHLVALRQMAGKPSFSTLEKAGREGLLKRATVSDILGGKRVQLPDWRFVRAFLEACRAIAEENGLDPAQLGTIADWKHAWDSASSGLIGTRFPGLGSSLDPAAASAGEEPVPVANAEARPPAATSAQAPPRMGGQVPAHTSGFVGRESDLAGIYRVFTQGAEAGGLVIQGLSGIGKTQLAIEYAHRYANQYDLIWWIACGTIERASTGMRQLEELFGIADSPTPPGEKRFAALFEELRTGSTYERWLLIFDDANEPDDIRDLLPLGPGHVLITSRSSRWDESAKMLDLDRFTRRDSVRFLQSRMRGLEEVDAQRLADAVGDLPLILEHVVESRIPVEEYLAQLDSDPLGLFSRNPPSAYSATIAETWLAMIAKLDSDNPASIGLLRCLSFFGRGPIPQVSLDRGRYLPGISLRPLLSRTILRTRAVRALARSGLLRVDNVTKTIHVHEITQRIARATLQPDEAERIRHDVHLLLAAADPDNPDDSDQWLMYEYLRGHLTPSGAESCEDPAVRRLIINVASYLCAVGDPTAALDLADHAMSLWSQQDDPERGDGPASLALCAPRVAALLALGRYDAAFALAADTLGKLSSAADQYPSESVVLSRVAGVELRIKGDFPAALRADARSALLHVDCFGYDDPQTFVAVNNHATDYALNGAYRMSIQRAESVYLECRAFYDKAEHPSILFYQNALARCYRLNGQYRNALALSETVGEKYRSVVNMGVMKNDHPWILVHKIDHAAARRDMGLSDPEMLDALRAEMAEVHQQCWGAFGADNPMTQAAAVTLGSLLRRLPGQLGEAARIVSEAQRWYGETLGPRHPYTYAASAFLASIRRQTGSAEEAVPELGDAITGLRDGLGDDHPYTLAAIAALVNALIQADAVQDALPLGEEALARHRRVLGPDHPNTLACAASVAAALSAAGHEANGGELRQDTHNRYVNTLGEEHPDVRLFTAGGLIDPDFTPLPL